MTSPPDLVGKLIDYINGGRLSVGARLPPIKKLAAELNVSSHTARETLLHAQAIGLVRVEPRSGAFVQSVSFSPLVGAFARALPRATAGADDNLLDLLEARRVIETELAGVAAARRRLSDLVPVKAALDGMYRDATDYPAYVRHNEEFHLRVAEIAGNRVLMIMLRHLLELLRPVLVERQPGSWAEAGGAKRAVDEQEHGTIYAGLLAGDPEATRAAVRVHLRDTTDSLVPVAGG